MTACTSITSATTCVATMSYQEKIPALLHTAESFFTNFLSSGCETQALLSTMKFARTFTHFYPTVLSKNRRHQAALTDLTKPSQGDQTHQGKIGDRKLCPVFFLDGWRGPNPWLKRAEKSISSRRGLRWLQNVVPRCPQLFCCMKFQVQRNDEKEGSKRQGGDGNRVGYDVIFPPPEGTLNY